MTATPSQDPFPANQGFDVEVDGGVPPYTYTPLPSPPNPPGVTMTGNTCTVPPTTPPGTEVKVRVTDSSTPPQRATCTSTTA